MNSKFLLNLHNTYKLIRLSCFNDYTTIMHKCLDSIIQNQRMNVVQQYLDYDSKLVQNVDMAYEIFQSKQYLSCYNKPNKKFCESHLEIFSEEKHKKIDLLRIAAYNDIFDTNIITNDPIIDNLHIIKYISKSTQQKKYNIREIYNIFNYLVSRDFEHICPNIFNHILLCIFNYSLDKRKKYIYKSQDTYIPDGDKTRIFVIIRYLIKMGNLFALHYFSVYIDNGRLTEDDLALYIKNTNYIDDPDDIKCNFISQDNSPRLFELAIYKLREYEKNGKNGKNVKNDIISDVSDLIRNLLPKSQNMSFAVKLLINKYAHKNIVLYVPIDSVNDVNNEIAKYKRNIKLVIYTSIVEPKLVIYPLYSIIIEYIDDELY